MLTQIFINLKHLIKLDLHNKKNPVDVQACYKGYDVFKSVINNTKWYIKYYIKGYDKYLDNMLSCILLSHRHS